MLLICPNCNKKYKMTAEQLGDVGRSVECSNCNHIWFSTAKDLVTPQEKSPTVSPQPAEKPLPERFEPSFETPAQAPQKRNEAAPSEKTEPSAQPDFTAPAPTSATQEPLAVAPVSVPVPPTPKPIAEDRAVSEMPKETTPSAVNPQNTPEEVKAQKLSSISPVIPKLPPQPSQKPSPTAATQRTPIAPIAPKPSHAAAPQSTAPQPQAKRNYESIHHDMNYNEDIKMFNEGADIFERIEQTPSSDQASAEKTQAQRAEEKPESPEKVAALKAQAQAQTSSVFSEMQGNAAESEKEEKTEQQAFSSPLDEAPAVNEETSLQSPKPIKNKSMPFFAHEDDESEEATKKPAEKQADATDNKAAQSHFSAQPTEASPALQREAPLTCATERQSETIVQNLPVIVKQDVNNELREALVRSQQLNSRLSLMVFANMLLLTGILILLLLKS